MQPLLVAIMGPTASGKTAMAEAIADRIDAQLINADAFQAYRGMDVGTAKPSNPGRYELIDVKSPDEGYGVGEFVLRAQAILAQLHSAGRSAVIVGGTGLYVRALMEEYQGLQPEPDLPLRASLNARLATEGLSALFNELLAMDPDTAEKVDSRNPVRVVRALERALAPGEPIPNRLPPFTKLKLGIIPNLETLARRIAERTHTMVQNGWVREVERLRESGYGPSDPGFQAIGYRAMHSVLKGDLGMEEAIATTIAETRRYAKRQRTWLRSEPRLYTTDSLDDAMGLVEKDLR